MIHRLIPTILFFLLYFNCFSQSYTVDIQEINVEDGLLHRDVLDILEDRNGFIWIGTSKGLQRYDGQNFKSWTRTSPTTKLQNVSALWLDQEDWLWIWDNRRLEFYFLNTISLEFQSEKQRFGDSFPIHRNTDGSGWSSGKYSAQTDTEGKLYFILSKPTRLIAYEKGGKFSSVPVPEAPNETSTLISIDKNGNLWMVSGKYETTLSLISPQGKVLASFDYSMYKNMTFQPDGNGKFNVHYQTENHAYNEIIDINSPQKPPVKKLSESRPKNIFAHDSGFTWVRGLKGWEIFDTSHQKLLATIDKDKQAPGVYELIAGLYQDSRNRAWIFGRLGLFRVLIKPSHFQKLLQVEAGQKINPSTRGIVITRDTIFVNLEFAGLAAIPKDAPENWKLIHKSPSVESYNGRPLIKTKNGDLISGFPGELLVLGRDGSTKKTIAVPGHISTLWALHEDQKGRIWIGNISGVGLLRPGEEKIEIVEGVLHTEYGIDRHVFHFSEPKEDEIWICGAVGLSIYDAKAGKELGIYGEEKEKPFYLPISTCFFHYMDRDGIHWIACDDGLVRWNKEKGTFRRFTVADGLPNDVIYAIYEDEAGYLWLSSDYGIIRFDRSTFQVEAYLPQHGISHHEFNKTSAVKSEDGTIYFGGLNGITAFHPKNFNTTKTERPFKVRLTGFEILNEDSDSLIDRTVEVAESQSIVFEPKDRFFRIRFALPVLDNPDKTLYAWRIEGLNENWNYQKENSIQISNLPYGDYTLAIKGQDNSRNWTEELRLKITALVPFYLQTWFLILVSIFFILGIFLLFKIRTRRYERRQRALEEEVSKATSQIEKDKNTIEGQAEELKELDLAKSRFFANVSHELRTPLTLILGPVSSVLKSDELSERNLRFLQNAEKNGKDLLKLVGSLLDLSKLESGKMQLQEQELMLFPLVRTIVSSFESHAQQAGIKFIFEYSADQQFVIQVDRNKLETILNNLLSNAVKYTPKGGEIKVKLEDTGAKLEIQVVDSGRGIHPDDLPRVFDRFYQSRQEGALVEGGTGIGLALSRELVKVMGGDIGVESKVGEGSRFWVRLPRKEVLGVYEEPVQPRQEEQPFGELRKITGSSAIESPGKKTILIVEDNYSLRDYLSMVLGAEYRLYTSENGQIAFDLLESLPPEQMPDLILSDIMMPEMDGYQLLELLKKSAQYRMIPVVMLTARAAIEDKLKALRIGVDDYLLKPFEEDELLTRISNLLQHAEDRNQFSQQEPEATAPPIPKIANEDQVWLENLEAYIEQNLESDLLSVTEIADEFAMSQSTLQRQLKRLVGLSPIKYIQEHRLNKARILLENRSYNTVAQVAYKVGFKDPKAFTRSFRKRFGKTPSEFFQSEL